VSSYDIRFILGFAVKFMLIFFFVNFTSCLPHLFHGLSIQQSVKCDY
jgi:hypothetical protein